MDVYKENSTGLFICKLCNKDHNTLAQAMECAASHPKPDVPAAPEPTQVESSAPAASNNEIQAYRDMITDLGTVKLAEKLCMSLIEDYLVSRQKDLLEKGRVGAMSLSLGKVAAEALIGLNKVTVPAKNVNVNVDAGKKSDITALKEMLGRDNVERNVEDDGKDRI